MNRLFATIIVSALLSALIVPLNGCLDGGTFDSTFDGTGTTEAAQGYADAIPSPEDVELRVPSDAVPNALIVGETARYYSETYRITHDINGTVYVILSILGDIVSFPPTSTGDGQAIWGPFTPALEPTAFLLVVSDAGEGAYEYALLARPRHSENPDDFEPIVAGRTEPSEAGSSHGAGQFVLDWTTYASMNPNIGLRGQMVVDYAHRPLRWRSVEMLFADFADPLHNPGAPPTNVVYRYLENEDTSGEFQFAYRADVHNGDPHRPLPETVRIRSRWEWTGAGRSDVQIHSPEIAYDLYTHLGIEQDYVAAAECWDEYFLRTYYNESPVWLSHEDGVPEEGAYDGPGQGDPESCVFSDSLFADDDVDVVDSEPSEPGSDEDGEEG